MTATDRTIALIGRMPRWFIEQHQAADARAQRSQQEWEETRRRNNAANRRTEPAFIGTADRAARDREGSQDTVAEFDGH